MSESNSSPVRLVALVVILVLFAAALVYDRGVAKKGWESAASDLDKMIDEAIAAPIRPQPKSISTNKDKKTGEEPTESAPNEVILFGVSDIQKRLGREPALSGDAAEAAKLLPKKMLGELDKAKWQGRQGFWELYQWRRGIPFMNYSIIVVYRGPSEMLYSKYVSVLNPDDFPGVAIPIDIRSRAGNAPVSAGAASAGSGGGKGGKKGRGKKGRGEKGPEAKGSEATKTGKAVEKDTATPESNKPEPKKDDAPAKKADAAKEKPEAEKESG